MKVRGKYRVTQISETGTRKTSLLTKRQLQKLRARRVKLIRQKDLGLTQKSLADVIGANVRTLQDWERGRSSMPKPVELLLELMKDIPEVRKKLLRKVA